MKKWLLASALSLAFSFGAKAQTNFSTYLPGLPTLPSGSQFYVAIPCTGGAANGCTVDNYRIQLLNAAALMSTANITSAQITAALQGQTAAQVATILGLGTAASQPVSAFDAAGAASAVQGASAQKSANLSDLANPAAARTNLGLGSAATQPSSAFDASGAATAAAAASIPASQKNAANGVAPVDANKNVPAANLGNVLALLLNRTALAPLTTVVGTSAVSIFPTPTGGGPYAHVQIPNALTNPAGSKIYCTFDGSAPTTAGPYILPGQTFNEPDNLGNSGSVSPICMGDRANLSILGTPLLPLGAN